MRDVGVVTEVEAVSAPSTRGKRAADREDSELSEGFLCIIGVEAAPAATDAAE